MTTFFVCVAYLGFGLLCIILGAVTGFIYAMRGDWTPLFDRIVPPRTQGQTLAALKELVGLGVITNDQAESVVRSLYTQAKREMELREWAEEQERARESAAETRLLLDRQKVMGETIA